jgi:hypothetical protein
MWRVLGDKISSLIFFPKTAPHKALTRSFRTFRAICVFRGAEPVSKKYFVVSSFRAFVIKGPESKYFTSNEVLLKVRKTAPPAVPEADLYPLDEKHTF